MSEKKDGRPTVDERYVRPRAAWEKMKAAQNTGQTVYLYGTTGSGKTSFVADFMGRKRYHYVTVAHIGIEEIMEMVQGSTDAQTILVIDDLHLLETEEDRSACGQLVEALSGRQDVWLILISRAPMPRWLSGIFLY